ncbi:MAG TPA: hypothetical protein VF175_09970 [Lacipirellula sp.]
MNSYDRAATMILASLIMVGAAVVSLGVIFFANKFTSTVEPIAFVPVEATSSTGNQGFAEDPAPPGVEDALELAEPQVEDALDALSTLTMDQTLLSDELLTATQNASQGEGAGDARLPGPGGEGVIERVPRWERWKIRWEPASARQFVNWLDQYKIRIGVLGRDNKVHAAWDFGGGSPQVSAQESKDYAAWGQTVPTDGPMPALVQTLARNAGILGRGPIVVLLYPFEVEQVLWTLEQEKNPTKDPNKVRETIFTVVADSDRFRFEITDQKYF